MSIQYMPSTERRPFPRGGGWPDVDGPIEGFPPIGTVPPGGGGQLDTMPLPNPEVQIPPTETPAPEEGSVATPGNKFQKGFDHLQKWIEKNPGLLGAILGGGAGAIGSDNKWKGGIKGALGGYLAGKGLNVLQNINDVRRRSAEEERQERLNRPDLGPISELPGTVANVAKYRLQGW
jgi:hypothetical protein